MQSLEDSQAFIELFPDSPTLNAVKMITSKLRYKWKAMEISDRRNKYFFQTMAEHVAFIQLDKCDWDGEVINHWILLTVPVSCESNQSAWESQQ